MYLMAVSASDIDEYTNADERCEEALSMKNLDKAKTFWSEFSKGLRGAKAIRDSLALLVDADEGLGGRITEKDAILAKAWAVFLDGGVVEESDLTLTYSQNDDGKTILEDVPDFGGIDVGPKKNEPAGPTPEEIEAAKKAARDLKAAELKAKFEAKTKAAPKPSATVGEAGSKDGKPPAPKLVAHHGKRQTRPNVQAANTAAALKADQELAKAGNKTAAAALKRHAAANGKKPAVAAN
jgi:hypothetical protein